MAISYEALFPDVLPQVRGCPDTLVENNIRSAAIEFCEKAEAYRIELDPITAVAKKYEYEFDVPSGTVVHRIEWMTYEGGDLEPLTSSLLEQRLPEWRDRTGKPTYYVQQSSEAFYIAPTPASNASLAIRVKAVLKPTHTSSACDNDVMNNYRDAIVNGALFRLLRMPNKDWTDLSAAGVYGSLFNEAIARASEIARGANTAVARKVKYGGIGGARSGARKTRRRDYGNNW